MRANVARTSERGADGRTVRGKRLRPLMREHSHVLHITGPKSFITALPKILSTDVILPPTCKARPSALVIPAHAKQTQAPTLLGVTAGQTTETWQTEYGVPWERGIERGDKGGGRMKGSHEGVAHTHVRTYVRMHARTIMCMYARTFTCMFRNKVTFKVTFYIKGNLISVRP